MKTKGEEYLDLYPKLHKWINECVSCHVKGYNPNMPEEIYPHPSFASNNIRSLFKPLELDENSLCKDCSRIMKKHNNK